jgi:hypothetical protein
MRAVAFQHLLDVAFDLEFNFSAVAAALVSHG